MTQQKNNFFVNLLLAVIGVILTLLYYSAYNIQKRTDILSEKVKALEDIVKSQKEPLVYTSSIKQTV